MSPSELVRAWVEAFNRGDVATRAAFYAENAVNHQVALDPVIGRSAIRAMFEREFAAANRVCIVDQILHNGEWAVLEWKDPLGLRGCGFFHDMNGETVIQRGDADKLSFHRLHGIPLREQESGRKWRQEKRPLFASLADWRSEFADPAAESQPAPTSFSTPS